MKTQFYILLGLKTPDGFETFGQYFLGDNQKVAYGLFDKLKGNPNLQDNLPLHIDLIETVETVDEVPVKVKTICCTLEQIAENSKTIAREIFRLKNFKAYEE